MEARKFTNRREFLKLASLGAATAVVVIACAPAAPPTPTPAPPKPAEPAKPAAEPTKPVAATPTKAPVAQPTPTPVPATPKPAAKAPVQLTYANYSSGADKDVWETLGKEFNQQHPNVSVKYLPVPGGSWGEYFDKLATQIAGGNPPDVVRVAIEGTQLFVAKGLALPLDDFIKTDPDIKEFFDDVHPRLLEVFRVGGKTYEFPLDWNNMFVFYNVKLFEKEGIAPPKKDWTKDDFLSIAKQLTKRSSATAEPEVWGFGFTNAYFSATMPWIFNAGSNLLSEDWTKSNANDPKLVEAIQFMRDLVWEHKVSPKPQGLEAQNLFAAGKIAMIGGGRWPVLGLTRAGFFDFDVQYWPKWREQITEYGVGGFPMVKGTRYPDEAWLWIRFLTSKRAFEYMTKLGYSIPARRSTANSPVMFELPPKNAKAYYESIEGNARPVPSPPEYNTVENIFLRYTGQVFANEKPAKEAMEGAHKEIAELLAKRPK